MHTGKNKLGLKNVIDMTRMIAIVVLLIHCYYNCYDSFKYWQLTSKIADELLRNLSRTGLLSVFLTGIGFILVMTDGGLITRIIKNKLNPDVPKAFFSA